MDRGLLEGARGSFFRFQSGPADALDSRTMFLMDLALHCEIRRAESIGELEKTLCCKNNYGFFYDDLVVDICLFFHQFWHKWSRDSARVSNK